MSIQVRWWCVVLAVAGLPAYVGAQPEQAATRHVPAVVSKGLAKPVGTLPAGQRMDFSILLPLRNQDQLADLLRRLYDPSSAEYHHFLSVPEFTERFGPTAFDYQSAVEWAEANEFTVRALAPNRLVISLSGTVAQVQSGFRLTMRTYRHPAENRVFFSADREPVIAQGIRIAHVAGLDNYSIPRPLLVKSPSSRRSSAAAMTGSGPGGSYLASDMRAAYYGETDLTGAGEKLALLEFDGYGIGDVASSFAGKATASGSGQDYVIGYTPDAAGPAYSVPVHNVLLGGATGAPGQFINPADDAEQALDIAQAIGMAPGLSEVRVYIGTLDADVLNAIAAENLARQISISWSWTPADPAVDDPFFEEFAAQGQSVFAASGDAGAFSPNVPFYYPAEDAWVTAVGGTTLVTGGAAGTWLHETGWGQSSGGISPDGISIPDWQAGVASPGNGASASLRNVPDVAMEADFDNFSCGMGWCSAEWGGTSFAAPRWAGLLALANQQAARLGQPPVGFLNPWLYAMAAGRRYGSELHDVAAGGNELVPGYGFEAGPGYDLVTGWGSPAGKNLVNDLAMQVTGSFGLSTTASSLTIEPGSTGATTIGVSGLGGFTGSVTLVVISPLPAGVRASFDTNPTSGTSVLSLAEDSWLSAQTYVVTVTGTSGGMTASADVTVNCPANVPLPAAAPPEFTPASGTYGSAQTVTMVDATPGAAIYYTTDGTEPGAGSAAYAGPINVSASATLQAIALATGFAPSATASAAYTITPVAVVSSLSPVSARAGGATFALTVHGSDFTADSVVFWQDTALPTQLVSASQVTAQVPAAMIAGIGVASVTVQGKSGLSNALQFAVDSAGALAPVFSSTTATASAGSAASYAVTLPSSVIGALVTCLNLPAAASCIYAPGAVTIATGAATPARRYTITVVFTETVSAESSGVLPLPFLVVPAAFLRRRRRGVVRVAAWVLMAVALGSWVSACGGGRAKPGSGSAPTTTQQVTASSAVDLVVK